MQEESLLVLDLIFFQSSFLFLVKMGMTAPFIAVIPKMDLFMCCITMKHLCNQFSYGLAQTFQQNSVRFCINQCGGRCPLFL